MIKASIEACLMMWLRSARRHLPGRVSSFAVLRRVRYCRPLAVACVHGAEDAQIARGSILARAASLPGLESGLKLLDGYLRP
jgi:hypothetical protein